MTIFYPDVSSYQGNPDLVGVPIVCAKVTEGTTYFNPYYNYVKGEAAAHGAYFTAYHFLHAGNGTGQASYAFAHASRVPLMLDLEPSGTSRPDVVDAVSFIDKYRADGGICHLLYFPKWYWQQLGSPSLKPFIDRGMLLVSSAYTTYTDSNTGAGWQAYGGMTPTVWQYTSSHTLNGTVNVDFNAFQGTVAEFKSLATTGRLSNDPPVLRLGDTGQDVIKLQNRLNIWGANLTVDGDFGSATELAVKAFQLKTFGAGPDVDGIVGPATWAELLKNPSPPAPDNKPVNDPVSSGDDIVVGFITPEMPVQALPFPAGQFSRIQILQDWPDKDNPPEVRVAVRSLKKGWSQIVRVKMANTVIQQVVFNENDVNAVSFSCSNPGHAIGYCLS